MKTKVGYFVSCLGSSEKKITKFQWEMKLGIKMEIDCEGS